MTIQISTGLSCSICGSPLPPRRTVFCSAACALTARKSRQIARRRNGRPRARTTAPKRLTRELMRSWDPPDADLAAAAAERPLDCPGRDGPCPWAGCRYHLYLDVNQRTGSIKINFPGIEPEELDDPCSLAIARRGALTLEETGARMNLTRERIRQVEQQGLLKLGRSAPR